MTRTIKLVLAGTALLGFIVGIDMGVDDAEMLTNETVEVASITADSLPSEFARRQFQYADSEHAREAVEFEIHILQELQRARPDSTLPMRLTLAYTRLGMIDEADGRMAEAKTAFDQARTSMKNSGKRARTDEELKSGVRMLDSASDRHRLL